MLSYNKLLTLSVWLAPKLAESNCWHVSVISLGLMVMVRMYSDRHNLGASLVELRRNVSLYNRLKVKRSKVLSVNVSPSSECFKLSIEETSLGREHA
jgi:hypothetical protein